MDALVPGDLLTSPREPEEIIAEAMTYKPRAIFAAFSGGDDSLVSTHWMMTNVPWCQVFHANTGIGIKATRQFVRDTCRAYGWPLHEIRAKEDCGQDYREIVLQYGFPGPANHGLMYRRLKERPVRLLTKRHKQLVRDKVLISTGIHHGESRVRMGYVDRNVGFVGSQMWVNPLYWWPAERFRAYWQKHRLRRNPVSELLGMSGECLCGAFAHKGEKALIRLVDPATADYLDALEAEVRARGHSWGWEDRPPRQKRKPADDNQRAFFMPFCRSCEKMGAA